MARAGTVAVVGGRDLIRPARRLAAWAVLGALAVAGCSRGDAGRGARDGGRGRQVYGGAVRAVRAAPDGATLAFLEGCADARTQFLPPQTASCDLRVVAAAGGSAATVARGVTTLPQGFAWSRAGDALAALGDYDYPSASGTLVLWRGAAAREVAHGVTFYAFGPRGELGYVAGGRLFLAPAGGEAREIPGARDVATFEIAPGGVPALDAGACPRCPVDVLARRTTAAGGALLAITRGRATEIAKGVAEYAFAPDGARFAFTALGRDGRALFRAPASEPTGPQRVAARTDQFAFSRAGDGLAFLGDVSPGRQGDLRIAQPGRPETVLARDVGEYRWATRAPRLAWLEKYDPRIRAGTVGAGGLDLRPRTLARNVSDFEVSADGKHVAFLQHTARGGYSVDLGLATLDAQDAPMVVGQGVFGFAFSPDARWLWYRTRCTRNAEACDLERVPLAGLAPGARPEAIAQGVKSFEFDARDPERVLVTWQRMDLAALDVAVWEHGKLVAVDTRVIPGTAQLLGPDSRRVAYAVLDPKRAGVYVAETAR